MSRATHRTPHFTSPLWASVLCAATLAGSSAITAAAGDAPKPKVAPTGSHPAQATAPIDWRTVGHAAPIPHQIPVVADANTALQAGFVPQWIERSTSQWPPSMQDPDLPEKTILRIAKGPRRAGDQWAFSLADKLNATLRIDADADVLRYARVFCGSVGCLCYFEIPLDSPSFDSFQRVRSDLLHGLLDDRGWGRTTFDIAPPNVGEVGELGTWELIYIVRGPAKG